MIGVRDSAVLTVDLPEHRLRVGDLGTVVLVHDPRGYEVELTTLDGGTIAVVSLTTAQPRPIARGEIAHVRPLEAA